LNLSATNKLLVTYSLVDVVEGCVYTTVVSLSKNPPIGAILFRSWWVFT